MLTVGAVTREILAYRLKLEALLVRFDAGERSTVASEAQALSDALVCLMEESPLRERATIDYLVDRYEALRISASN